MNYNLLGFAGLLCILLLFQHQPAAADYIWTPGCIQAWDQVSRLNFREAETLIRQEKTRRPANLIPYYIESQADFLKSFVYEDEEALAALKEHNEIRIGMLEDQQEASPYQRFCIAEMHLQLTVAKIRFREFIGAAYELRKAFKLLQENQSIYPNFLPNLRGLGLIHAAVGAVPKNYQWMAGVLGLRGAIRQGLDELQRLYKATKSTAELSFMKEETIVMLTFLEINLDQKKNFNLIRQRFQDVQEIQQKPILLFAKSNLHAAAAENDSVILLLNSRQVSPAKLPYLCYMEGNARLHKLDPKAEDCYLNYLKFQNGTSYRASSLQRLAWSNFVKGDLQSYRQYLSKIPARTTGEQADEDKAAMKEAREGILPNATLLKARLLFDGGYYQQALGELAAHPLSDFPLLKDKLEFTYRFARIMDKTGNTDKAIEYYTLTLKNGASQPYYFAANSALLLGQLYEAKENKKKAIEYYKITLSMRNHEFQNSIDQKAKSGLNRLGES